MIADEKLLKESLLRFIKMVQFESAIWDGDNSTNTGNIDGYTATIRKFWGIRSYEVSSDTFCVTVSQRYTDRVDARYSVTTKFNGLISMTHYGELFDLKIDYLTENGEEDLIKFMLTY